MVWRRLWVSATFEIIFEWRPRLEVCANRHNNEGLRLTLRLGAMAVFRPSWSGGCWWSTFTFGSVQHYRGCLQPAQANRLPKSRNLNGGIRTHFLHGLVCIWHIIHACRNKKKIDPVLWPAWHRGESTTRAKEYALDTLTLTAGTHTFHPASYYRMARICLELFLLSPLPNGTDGGVSDSRSAHSRPAGARIRMWSDHQKWDLLFPVLAFVFWLFPLVWPNRVSAIRDSPRPSKAYTPIDENGQCLSPSLDDILGMSYGLE